MNIVLDEEGVCIEKLCSCSYLVRFIPDKGRYPALWNASFIIHIKDGIAHKKGFSIAHGSFSPSQLRKVIKFLRNQLNINTYTRLRKK